MFSSCRFAFLYNNTKSIRNDSHCTSKDITSIDIYGLPPAVTLHGSIDYPYTGPLRKTFIILDSL